MNNIICSHWLRNPVVIFLFHEKILLLKSTMNQWKFPRVSNAKHKLIGIILWRWQVQIQAEGSPTIQFLHCRHFTATFNHIPMPPHMASQRLSDRKLQTAYRAFMHSWFSIPCSILLIINHPWPLMAGSMPAQRLKWRESPLTSPALEHTGRNLGHRLMLFTIFLASSAR